MKITVTCIKRIRDRNNRIVGYTLLDRNKGKRNVTPEELKHYIRTGKLEVKNLTLTTDNRLVGKKLEQKKREPKAPKKKVYSGAGTGDIWTDTSKWYENTEEDEDENKELTQAEQYIRNKRIEDTYTRLRKEYFLEVGCHLLSDYESYLISILPEFEESYESEFNYEYAVGLVEDMAINDSVDIIDTCVRKNGELIGKLKMNTGTLLPLLLMQIQDIMIANEKQKRDSGRSMNTEKLIGLTSEINGVMLDKLIREHADENGVLYRRRVKAVLNSIRDRVKQKTLKQRVTYNDEEPRELLDVFVRDEEGYKSNAVGVYNEIKEKYFQGNSSAYERYLIDLVEEFALGDKDDEESVYDLGDNELIEDVGIDYEEAVETIKHMAVEGNEELANICREEYRLVFDELGLTDKDEIFTILVMQLRDLLDSAGCRNSETGGDIMDAKSLIDFTVMANSIALRDANDNGELADDSEMKINLNYIRDKIRKEMLDNKEMTYYV